MTEQEYYKDAIRNLKSKVSQYQDMIEDNSYNLEKLYTAYDDMNHNKNQARQVEKKLAKGEISEEQIEKEDVEKLRAALMVKKKSLEKQLDNYAKKIYNILSKDDKFLNEYRKYNDGVLDEKSLDEALVVKFRTYKMVLNILSLGEQNVV